MFESRENGIAIAIPPWPTFLGGSYRFFMEDERHVTRICNDFVLLFVLERTLYFTEDGHDIEVKPGEWYIQVPGLLQEGRRGSPAPVYYYIHFWVSGSPCSEKEGSILQVNQENWGYPRHVFLPVRGKFEKRFLTALFDQLDYMTKYSQLDIFGRQALFLNICNSLMFAHPTEAKSHSLAAQIMDYLVMNFTGSITCEDLARKFHFTVDYLTRILKRNYGVTPWQYIQQLRVGKAKELLSYTDYILPRIADMVGYNDYSVFYKAFIKQTGMAPGEWRLRSRGLPSTPPQNLR